MNSRGGRKDLIALTEDELTELGEKAVDVHGEFGPTFRAMVVFAAYVGLRPGELYALERADVGRDEVTIRQNLDGTGTIKAPKNGRERVVILPPPAREALATFPSARRALAVRDAARSAVQQEQPHLLLEPGQGGVRASGHGLLRAAPLLRDAPARAGRSHADVAIQLGHTDGGALVMSTYGHPSRTGARAAEAGVRAR